MFDRKKYDRNYYLKNKKHILARQKKFRDAHKELIRTRKRKYYLKNREAILEKAKEYAKKNKHIRDKWRYNNPDKIREYNHNQWINNPNKRLLNKKLWEQRKLFTRLPLLEKRRLIEQKYEVSGNSSHD